MPQASSELLRSAVNCGGEKETDKEKVTTDR